MMEHFRRREPLLLVLGVVFGLSVLLRRKGKKRERHFHPWTVCKNVASREKRILRFDVTANYDAKKDTRLAIFG